MSFTSDVLSRERPVSIRSVVFPRRKKYFPSPTDWMDEVLYFLLPDRFSDGQEHTRPMLNRQNPEKARPAHFRFDLWAQSAGERWQGGTITGIKSKLSYLKGLGVTAIWVGPVFKQRSHLNTYHGYAIQDFLDIDPRLGTRQDLVELVAEAHAQGTRVILDVIFNHSGCNWIYPGPAWEPPYKPHPHRYEKGDWLDENGGFIQQIPPDARNAGVWPVELQRDECYTRAGTGDLAAGDLRDPDAEFRRTDFMNLRDFHLEGTSGGETLSDLINCYKYWIALTDCDGFRIDTLKHVSDEAARNFCGSIKEYAANLGKADFFLVGEVAGSDHHAARYRHVLGHNLNATLDIGSVRETLKMVAKGLTAPDAYLSYVKLWMRELGSHRNAGSRHVLILDDHDHVVGDKVRFSADAASEIQVVAAVALQLFCLGIPCIYYGTEQSFAGPEKAMRDQFLPDFRSGNDKYLREAMFGPLHPRKDGNAGLAPGAAGLDESLPGCGPFGTVGHHCFDPQSPAYVRIAALTALRHNFPVLRYGRQYQRPVSNYEAPFSLSAAGEIVAWSRILDDEEALCIVNGHGTERRGADVLVDPHLNKQPRAKMQVIANTHQSGAAPYHGAHPIGSYVPVLFRNGNFYIEMRDIHPSEVIVLVNQVHETNS